MNFLTSTLRNHPALALVFAFSLAAPACQCGETEPVEVAAPLPPLPSDPWSYVGDAPAWIHVNVATLREDERAAALWERAGATDSGDPLNGAIASAEDLVIAWRDAGFSHRINVVTGPIGGEALRESTLSTDFTPYTAGRTQMWSRAGSPWAVSVPTDRVLITGTPEAVRAAVSSPCYDDCAQTLDATVTAHLKIMDLHRSLAGAVVDSRALVTALTSIDTIDATLNLSLGLDIHVDVDLLAAQDPAGVALLLTEALEALRETLSDDPAATFANGLLARVRTEVGDGRVNLYLELSRQEVDALAAVIARSMGNDDSNE